MNSRLTGVACVVAWLLLGAGSGAWAQCPTMPVNGGPDNERDDLDYYYIITGGKFPTGTIPNGDNASGGTFRYFVDDPGWGGYPLDTWNKDDWFPQNAAFALTLRHGAAIVYDNNGIEDGTYGTYYDGPATGDPYYGLYRGYSMSNNWDWIYAGYFKLEEATTFDTMIGYFDATGFYGTFDPLSPFLRFRMNIWSSVQQGPTAFVPVNTHSFTGDVFASDCSSGTFSVSPTGVDRILPIGYVPPTDPIWRLTFKLAQPLTLPAGVYFFSHDAAVTSSPQVVKHEVTDAIAALASTASGPVAHNLAKAANAVEKSLEPGLWIDEDTLAPKGVDVFVREKQAADYLLKAKAANLAEQLARADAALATLALADAQEAADTAGCSPGDTTRPCRQMLSDIGKAEKELGKGQAALAAGDYEGAIEAYKRSWSFSQKVL